MIRETANGEVICCPHCLANYKLSMAKPDYIHRFNGFDEIFYVALCFDCRRLVKSQRKVGRKHTVQRIGLNIFSNPEKWLSVTTEVSMVMNDYSFSDALLNGHGLTRAGYDAVKQCGYWKLPFAGSGLIMIWT